MDHSTLIRHYLLYFIFPLWIAAGVADYMLHRRTQIEETSGTKESLLHMLQLGETGIASMAGLLLDINALVLLIMLVTLIAHEATALWDASIATGSRYVGVLEQHIHSFLELLPLMAFTFVTILSWQQFIALFGLGSETARFELRLKDDPLPLTYLVSLFGAIVLLVVIPYSEELRRCLRLRYMKDEQGSQDISATSNKPGMPLGGARSKSS